MLKYSGLAVLALAGLVSGCGGSSGGAPSSWSPAAGPALGSTAGAPSVREPGDPCPRVRMVTAEGVVLEYPVWLDYHPARKSELLAEIRDVVPDADPRIPSGTRGVPAGVTVIVLDPGGYYAPYSPTLLASGEWRGSTLYVAWRGSSSGPLVPALPHELRHYMTNDPNAGH